MAAFERIHSGISGIDAMLDDIRLGDNVVWQLAKLDDFRCFVDPFVRQAISDGRNLVYIRFSSDAPLVARQKGVKVYELDPKKGFEPFTIDVRDIITREGRDAFYVFDCLSELQVAWSADMMMGNFFRVTCPYLFKLDTVAFFPIIRGHHSFDAVAKIRDTTQLLIDVYPEKCGDFYIHPLKVWNRNSATMFLPHLFHSADSSVEALTDGLQTSRFFNAVNNESVLRPDLNTDNWDRFFQMAQLEYAHGTLSDESCRRMCNMMMTKDPKMRSMIERFFEPTDFFAVRNRMVGTGIIGGKACGMLLARKIIEKNAPDCYARFEEHDSFYIGSDVFYTYIVNSNLWEMRIRQRTEEGFFAEAPMLKQGLLEGSFPEEIRESFRRVLEYYGQSPIIVRSSSFLEDGFGNAFAGKYESVFCANAGSLEERLEAFEQAVRHVYASTMDPSALEYRLRNGLSRKEEQMCLLIQRVSGSHYGTRYFMPSAAGVGYSYSAYCWMPDMDPAAGMLRLVCGLGTRAVDRTQDDYPRIISLDKPLATTRKNMAELHRYSQHAVDLLDLEERTLAERPVDEILPLMPPYCEKLLFEHDTEAEQRLRERGKVRKVMFASCQGLVANTDFTTLMRHVLQTLEESYDYPVDIEYAINVGDNGDFVVNLLQCRPLQVTSGREKVEIPRIATDDTYFHIEGCTMGRSRSENVDVIVSVDPERYYNCPYATKPLVATTIGLVNRHYKEQGKNLLLMVPGRVGTSSPELGVPVTFADISEFSGICEISYSQAGYMPELSFGSHLFQDFVEADIFYGAIFENEHTARFDIGFPMRFDNIIEDICELPADGLGLEDMVRVVEVGSSGVMLFHDMMTEEALCGIASK